MHFFIIILSTVIASACATVEPPHRGDLSEAMKVASDQYEGERHLNVPDSSVLSESQTDDTYQTESANPAALFAESNNQTYSDKWEKSFMFSRGYGRGFGDYQELRNVTLRAGGENKYNIRSEIYIGYEGITVDADSTLSQSINGKLDILFAGVGIKYYFRPFAERIRPYVSAQAGGAYMIWSYRNPFTTADGATISGDNLSGFTISTATGIEFKPVRFLSLVIEANPKVHLWDERTGRGFDNNEFNPLATVALSLGASLLF